MAHHCDTCLRDFDKRANLVKHLHRKNRCVAPSEILASYRPDPDSLTCEFCGAEFSAKSNLSRHKHKHCKKSPFVMKVVAPVSNTTTTTNITSNTDSHDTTATDSHDTNIDSHDTNTTNNTTNITQYFIIYNKKLTLDQIKEIDPLKTSCHPKLHETFPDVLYPFVHEDTSGILDVKFIKKSYNTHNPLFTFRAIFFGIYTLPGNRCISLPNKSKPVIISINRDLNILSANIKSKVNDIKATILGYYETIYQTMKESIRKTYYKTHDEFLRIIQMTTAEIELEEQKLKDEACKKSRVGNDDNDDIIDDRISNEEYINMKSIKCTKFEYDAGISKIIEEYFENESYRNCSLMKKHKVIVGSIKDVLKHKSKEKISRLTVDTRPKNLEENLIRFCGGKPIKQDTSSDDSSDEDEPIAAHTSPRFGLSSMDEFKFSDEE